MKNLILFTLAGVASASFCFGKNYKITEEEEAFAAAEKAVKGVAYVFG